MFRRMVEDYRALYLLKSFVADQFMQDLPAHGPFSMRGQALGKIQEMV